MWLASCTGVIPLVHTHKLSGISCKGKNVEVDGSPMLSLCVLSTDQRIATGVLTILFLVHSLQKYQYLLTGSTLNVRVFGGGAFLDTLQQQARKQQAQMMITGMPPRIAGSMIINRSRLSSFFLSSSETGSRKNETRQCHEHAVKRGCDVASVFGS